jgi:DNA invertase Pin-like site-specific DNA recombinase
MIRSDSQQLNSAIKLHVWAAGHELMVSVIERPPCITVSGAKGRKDRPGLDALLNDAQRGKFSVVMAWAIDRIGRSLIDLLGTIQRLEACGCDLYLDQQSLDTTTPSGKLMFQICGAFGEFERGMIRERVNAGLARARKAGKVLGRKPGTILVDRSKLEVARKLLAGGTGMRTRHGGRDRTRRRASRRKTKLRSGLLPRPRPAGQGKME